MFFASYLNLERAAKKPLEPTTFFCHYFHFLSLRLEKSK
jgi:hypothetical protein